MVSLTCAKELSEKVRYKEDLPSLAQEHSYDLSAHKDSMLRHGLLISPSLTPLLEQRIVDVCENLGVPRDCISAFVHNSSEVQADCFIDTPTTWRIGDATAAFYNYVYYTVAGFTEHDTFRSNQIREGDITREEALELIREENKPRYPNIKWYLDVLGIDFGQAIRTVNNIHKLYKTF